MGFLKRLFGLEKKEEIQEIIPDPILTEAIKAEPQLNGSEEICDACGRAIWGEQQPIHKFGKVYHNKPCWRNKQKEAKRLGFAGKLPS
jgi:hypothetical protein